MVSSVLVEFVGDDDKSGSSTTEAGEVGKTISGRDVALGVGEEGMFGMKVELTPGHGLKPMCENLGNWGTPPILIKNAI